MASLSATATDLVAYVNTLLELSANPLDFTTEIKKNDVASIVAAIAPKAEQLLAHDAETDVEGAFSMLFDLVRALPADAASTHAAALLAAVLAKTDDDKAVLRLRIATTLFNKSAVIPHLRFDALVHVIAFASKTNNIELVASYFDSVESLFAASPLSPAQRRTLFLTIADALDASSSSISSTTSDATKRVRVLLLLEKYLATFSTSDSVDASAKAVAERAALLVLQQPVASFIARVDLLACPAVAVAMKGNALLELLEIVSNKTLPEFQTFRTSANGAAVFKQHAAHLDADALEATQRLFTLCALPAGFDAIPYATIASALAIDDDAVEQWVVKAITAGLVTAKIDQLARTVVLSQTLVRGFNAAQWQAMAATLAAYKTNVASLLQVVRAARQAHPIK